MSYFIVLRGPLGSGKSTIAKRLSKILDAQHVFIDKVLEEHNLDSIPSGEPCIPIENFIKANDIVIPSTTKILQNDKIVIFDACFYHKEVLEDLLKRLPFSYFVFTLKAPLSVCIERDNSRDNTYGEGAAMAVHSLVSKFDFGILIDATKSLDQVIEEILSYVEVGK